MANKKRDDICSICEVDLMPMEYDICDKCRRNLGATEEDKYRPPDEGPPDEGEWR